MICKKCGKKVSENADFCWFCGNKIEKTAEVNATDETGEKRFCAACGNPIEANWDFCFFCGKRVEKAVDNPGSVFSGPSENTEISSDSSSKQENSEVKSHNTAKETCNLSESLGSILTEAKRLINDGKIDCGDTKADDIDGVSDTLTRVALGLINSDDDDSSHGKSGFYLLEIAESINPDNFKAIANIGLCYYYGTGVEKDIPMSIPYFRRASDMGYDEAMVFLANHLLEEMNPECIPLFEKLSEGGSGYASDTLGRLFHRGEITERDDIKALDYYKKGYEQGDVSAELALAEMYLLDDDANAKIENNPFLDEGIDLARNAYERAKDASENEALNEALQNKAAMTLLIVFEDLKDRDRILEWAEKTADYNQGELAEMAANDFFLGRNGVEVDNDLAVELFEIASKAGNVEGKTNLAYCLANGTGVEPDFDRALCLYKEAALGGSRNACAYLLEIIKSGQHPEENDDILRLLRECADDGNPHAAMCAFICYYNGISVEEDKMTAIHYAEIAAEQENPRACYIMGNELLSGELVERDIDKATRNLEIAANSKEAGIYGEAAFLLGMLFLNGRYKGQGPRLTHSNRAKAIYWLEFGAEESGNASYFLGGCYDKEFAASLEDGFLKEDNIEKALDYYQNSYEKGNEAAAFKIGGMYWKGDRIEKNCEKALEYLKYASDRGNANASYIIFCILFGGDGVKRDVAKGVEYLKLSGRQGKVIQETLSIVYGYPLTEGVDAKEAFAFNRKNAENGDAEGQFRMFKAYWDGIGVEENLMTAMTWCEKAARQGHKDAQLQMGIEALLHDDKEHAVYWLEKCPEKYYGMLKVKRYLVSIYGDKNGRFYNLEKAVKELEDIINAGETEHLDDALYLLWAIYYQEGKYNKMLPYLQKSADRNNAESLRTLGICYYKGTGVPSNLNKAKEYWRKAAMLGDSGAKELLAAVN